MDEVGTEKHMSRRHNALSGHSPKLDQGSRLSWRRKAPIAFHVFVSQESRWPAFC
jgi:hypothetical protein